MKYSSFGKVILSGEHSAVYGHPALAAALDLAVEVEIANTRSSTPFFEHIKTLFAEKFSVDCEGIFFRTSGDLPSGSGLGSSAATAHAALQALTAKFGILLSGENMITLIQESERFAHGHPSGLDAATVVQRGVLAFRRIGDGFEIEKLAPELLQRHTFFLLQSGAPQESTKDMIALVRSRAPNTLLQKIGELTARVITQYKTGVMTFEWMDENEACLEELGVVSESAKKIVDYVRACGAHAKITGAGGVTAGSGMILAYHPDSDKLEHQLQKLALPYVRTHLGST